MGHSSAAALRRHLRWLITLLLVFTSITLAGPVFADQSVQPTLTVTPYWLTYDSPWTAYVGQADRLMPFQLQCSGAQELTVRIQHTNPQFKFDSLSETVTCGGLGWIQYVYFEPTAPGLTYDSVTFSSGSATAVVGLTGLGIAIEQADYWLMDLGENVSPNGILYDDFRDRVYVSSRTVDIRWPPSDELLVISPASRSVIARIKTGSQPAEMALSPEGNELYVANSGEHTLSVISPDTLVETKRIQLPNLHPTSGDPYTPWRLAWVGDDRLLIASRPPGLASGGPLYELDMRTLSLKARGDTGFPAGFFLAGSRNRQSAALLNGALYSSTGLLRYDAASDAMTNRDIDETGAVSIDNNGGRLITSYHYPAYGHEPIQVYDQELNLRARLDGTDVTPVRTLVNPVMPNVVYGFADRNHIAVWRLDQRRQVAEWEVDLPYPYMLGSLLPAISGDGAWLYAPVVNTYYWPPSKLVGIRLGRQPYSDAQAPSTTVTPLAPKQEQRYWRLEWQGVDAGSGIDRYEVWGRAGDAPWQLLKETRSTWTLIAAAQLDQTDCFRVIAIDRAGNVELFRSQPDTCTVAGSAGSGLRHNWLPAVSVPQ